MKIEINKVDKTNEVLIFAVSLLYVLTNVFMLLTKQYEALPIRNSIFFMGTKTSMLLASIVFFRSVRGWLSFFTVILLSFCVVNVFNEILYVLQIADVNSFLTILYEMAFILLLFIIYKKYGRG